QSPTIPALLLSVVVVTAPVPDPVLVGTKLTVGPTKRRVIGPAVIVALAAGPEVTSVSPPPVRVTAANVWLLPALGCPSRARVPLPSVKVVVVELILVVLFVESSNWTVPPLIVIAPVYVLLLVLAIFNVPASIFVKAADPERTPDHVKTVLEGTSTVL